MSNVVAESVTSREPLQRLTRIQRICLRGAKWLFLLLFLAWVAGAGISLLINHSRLQQRFTARLEAALGRPVKVGSYGFSIWDGPELEVHPVTVAEDPRFGREYFLRAESMSVRLSWESLLRGHVALTSVSLTGPSVNLVRNAAGDWNLSAWLPRPAADSAASAAARVRNGKSSALRFRRIEVNGGRINFKHADDKLPVAFVDVNGTVETTSPGRWRLDLEATPWRAAAIVQQAGTIRVAGFVGGTSSRLRPADLNISWRGSDVSDMLRLAFGNDYGVRGTMAVFMNARSVLGAPDGRWTIHGRAEFEQVHRWDLPLRPNNPTFNVIVKRGVIDPHGLGLNITDATIEAPHSSARVVARISWADSQTFGASSRVSPTVIHLSSAQVGLRDVLAWVQAFRPDVDEGLMLRGTVDARANLTAWPLQLTNAVASSKGVVLTDPAFHAPVHVGPFAFRYRKGSVSLAPTAVSLGAPDKPPAGLFQVDAVTRTAFAGMPAWHVAGSTKQVRNLIAVARAFGWNISRGWDVEGPFACDLRWREAPELHAAAPIGWIEFGTPGTRATDASLKVPFLNQTVDEIRARADLTPSATRISLSSAQAFGAHWTGKLSRRTTDFGWQFVLSANDLAARNLDRWLDPRWRESLLDRMLPFLGYRSQANLTPDSLRATGTVSIGQFDMKPFSVQRLRGELSIRGRHLEFTDARGQFYGGELRGALRVDLHGVPTYHADLNFSSVDMSALLDALPQLSGIRAQDGSGRLSLDARGASREALVSSVECSGDVRATRVEVPDLDPQKLFGPSAGIVTQARFRDASAAFSCSNATIHIARLNLLAGASSSADGSGSIGFNRDIDVRLQVNTGRTGGPERIFHISGPLASSRVTQTVVPLRPLR